MKKGHVEVLCDTDNNVFFKLDSGKNLLHCNIHNT